MKLEFPEKQEKEKWTEETQEETQKNKKIRGRKPKKTREKREHGNYSSNVLGLIKPLRSMWSASTRATIASPTGTMRGGLVGS
jgi:hypothetical protein